MNLIEKYMGYSYEESGCFYVKNPFHSRGSKRRTFGDWAWFLLNFMVLFFTFIHEMGHFLAAKYIQKKYDLQIYEIVIGKIQPNYFFRFSIDQVPLYVYPRMDFGLSGFVAIRNALICSIQYGVHIGIFIFLSGPLLQLLVFIFLFWAFKSIFSFELSMIWPLFYWLGTLFALINLLPLKPRVDGWMVCLLASVSSIDKSMTPKQLNQLTYNDVMRRPGFWIGGILLLCVFLLGIYLCSLLLT